MLILRSKILCSALQQGLLPLCLGLAMVPFAGLQAQLEIPPEEWFSEIAVTPAAESTTDLSPPDAAAEALAAAAGMDRVLGTIDFPTSTSNEEAQEAFVRGMLLLHLFEYEVARAEFRMAQELDPGFAMAYWGEAMTFNHPLWDEQDRDSARKVLVKLAATPQQRQDSTQDPREQAFLATLEILYGDGPKAQRDRDYLRAFERMAVQYPEDHEVSLFYALALMGVHAGVRDIPSYLFATALAQDVFSANPRHPGAAHYLIHGVDDPLHAVLGLSAARALAEMAPDAGHSLHMTSHIFLALGMWDDVVTANQNAVRVQNDLRELQGLPRRHWGHYNFWLLYGLLQQGRHADALDLLRAAYGELLEHNQSPADPMQLNPDRDITGSVVQMWARYLVETRDWNGPVSDWSFKLGTAFDPNLTFSFVQGMRAAHGGEAHKAGEYLRQFRVLSDDLQRRLRSQTEQAPGHLLYLQRLSVLEKSLEAGIELARGDRIAAARLAGEASRVEGEMPYSFGPPYVDWPSAELQADLLFDAGKYGDAIEAYTVALERARQRSRSLLGLAVAHQRLGDEAEARHAADRLQRIWRNADADVKAQLGGR